MESSAGTRPGLLSSASGERLRRSRDLPAAGAVTPWPRRPAGVVAAIVSALFFGIRHATQLALPWRDCPWGAAALWSGFAFLVGLGLSWQFERARSLRPVVLVHCLFNLIPALARLAAPAG